MRSKDAPDSQELVPTFTPVGRVVGIAAGTALLTTACASSSDNEPHTYTSGDQRRYAASPDPFPGRAVGVPDTVVHIPAEETVLAIRSGAGDSRAPVALPAAPELVLYARCSGGRVGLKGEFGADVQIPCGPVQIRQQVVGGDLISVVGDPSARWTFVVTRRHE